MTERPPEYVALPNPRLTVTAEADDMFPIRHRDWQRVRQSVEGLKAPARFASSLAWACVGISVSAGLALVPWLPSRDQLPEKAKIEYAWVEPCLVILMIAATAVAVVIFILAWQFGRARTHSATLLLADMDAIYQPYKHMGNTSHVDSNADVERPDQAPEAHR